MQCKYCGKEVEQIPGKKMREYCSDSHRQLAYVRRKAQEKANSPDQAQASTYTTMLAELEDLRTQNAALRIEVADKDQEIDELAAQIATLRERLDVERRFLDDVKPRSFKAFLRKRPATLLITRILDDPLFLDRDTRIHYQTRLHFRLSASKEELQEFTDLWKLMLLEASY